MSISKKPMKGSAPDPKYPLRFPLYASIKYDGVRLMMDGRKPRTNAMKELANLHTRQALADSPGLADCDLELISGEPTDPLCYNKTFRAVSTIASSPEVDFYVFDIVSETLPWHERQKVLHQRFIEGLMPPNAKLVPQHRITSQAELDALYALVTELGHEGLILRNPEGHYKYGRATAKSQDLLKLKPEEDFEFKILSCYEAMENQNEAFTNELGRTDRSTHAENLVGKGTLGGFIAMAITQGESQSFELGTVFNCAPGKLTHEERAEVWRLWAARPDEVKKLIGKCRHFPVGVKNLPRHPRWVGWRSLEDM